MEQIFCFQSLILEEFKMDLPNLSLYFTTIQCSKVKLHIGLFITSRCIYIIPVSIYLEFLSYLNLAEQIFCSETQFSSLHRNKSLILGPGQEDSNFAGCGGLNISVLSNMPPFQSEMSKPSYRICLNASKKLFEKEKDWPWTNVKWRNMMPLIL